MKSRLQTLVESGRVRLEYPNGDVRVLPLECYLEIPEGLLVRVKIAPVKAGHADKGRAPQARMKIR
jgi:hypothetical protein